MANDKPRMLIAGSGIGGSSAAPALLQRGFDVDVYEQAATRGGERRRAAEPERHARSARDGGSGSAGVALLHGGGQGSPSLGEDPHRLKAEGGNRKTVTAWPRGSAFPFLVFHARSAMFDTATIGVLVIAATLCGAHIVSDPFPASA